MGHAALFPLLLLIARSASGGGWFSPPGPAPAVTACLHPDCRDDCSDCTPAEVTTALKGSTAVGDPATSWTVQLNAANALVELLDTPAAPAHRAVIASMGGIEALLAVTDATLEVQPKTEIATGGSEEQISQLLVQLITALGRLSIDNSHIQASIAAQGGIKKITRAMSVGHHRYSDSELVTQSCWALAQLGKNNLPNQKAIVGDGAVKFAERAINNREGRTGYCRNLIDVVRLAARALGVEVGVKPDYPRTDMAAGMLGSQEL